MNLGPRKSRPIRWTRDPWWTSMTWTCHVCRRDRPDRKIGVRKRPVYGHEDMWPQVAYNVRYCLDNPNCVAAATASGAWIPGG